MTAPIAPTLPRVNTIEDARSVIHELFLEVQRLREDVRKINTELTRMRDRERNPSHYVATIP